jgi:8-oxo-dGTP pyrophosphatase MutT (NUDIX family)
VNPPELPPSSRAGPSASTPTPAAPNGVPAGGRDRDSRGYRVQPGISYGPRVRTDVVDLYVATLRSGTASSRDGGDPEWAFLQLLRAKPPLPDTWQPVMGHIEAGETAVDAVLREAREEIGLDLHNPQETDGLWALEQVYPFYIAAIDCVVMSPRFVAVVKGGWEPTLNREHSLWRWVPASSAWRQFMWPGQMAALREIAELLNNHGPARDALRLGP